MGDKENILEWICDYIVTIERIMMRESPHSHDLDVELRLLNEIEHYIEEL